MSYEFSVLRQFDMLSPANHYDADVVARLTEEQKSEPDPAMEPVVADIN